MKFVHPQYGGGSTGGAVEFGQRTRAGRRVRVPLVADDHLLTTASPSWSTRTAAAPFPHDTVLRFAAALS